MKGMTELNELQKKACGSLTSCQGGAWLKWTDAGYYALKNHAGYAAAFSANKAAKELFEAIQEKAGHIIDELASDPGTDPSWFDPHSGPVFMRDHAYWALGVLGNAKQALIEDLAAHFTIRVTEVALDPEAAAKDADAAAKADPHFGYHPGTRPNPNKEDPHDQSNEHPKEDVPPDEVSEGLPWYVYAGAAAVVAALFKVFG